MLKSKGKPFTFHHYWALLKKNQKWGNRNNEALPKRARSRHSYPKNDGGGDEVGEGDDDGWTRSPTPYLMRPKRKKHEKDMLKTSMEVGALGEKLDEIVRTRRWQRR